MKSSKMPTQGPAFATQQNPNQTKDDFAIRICKPSMNCPCGSYRKAEQIGIATGEETENLFKIAFAEEFGL
ncbi:MAG: hypothetical protein AAF990_24410 [Bacteroidota bacterium]